MIDPEVLKRLKESFKRSNIKISKRIEIINLFLSSENNTVPEICKELNISRQIVNMTLDRYFEILQTKKNKNISNHKLTDKKK